MKAAKPISNRVNHNRIAESDRRKTSKEAEFAAGLWSVIGTFGF
jgi:hypothetical protein